MGRELYTTAGLGTGIYTCILAAKAQVGEEKKGDLDQVDDPSSQSKEDLHLYIVIFAFWDSVQESTFY